MGEPDTDPLAVDSHELGVWRWYAATRRAIWAVTVGAVPSSWPAVVRRPLAGLAGLIAILATLVAWVPITIMMAFNLLGRRSPSGR